MSGELYHSFSGFLNAVKFQKEMNAYIKFNKDFVNEWTWIVCDTNFHTPWFPYERQIYAKEILDA